MSDSTQQRIERIARQLAYHIAPFAPSLTKDALQLTILDYLTAFAEEEANKWQPIETAPKDGTWVLLATSEGIQCGYWGASWADSPSWIKYHHRSDQEPVLGKITHWQPLPEAPKQD